MVRVVRAHSARARDRRAGLARRRAGRLSDRDGLRAWGPRRHPAALRRIFELKGRPTTHPLIVHIDSARYLARWAREVPESASKLAERFWPGPLTLVLPRAENVHRLVTGGQDTVAVRVPSHPMAQQLLTAFGGGIAAPSANRYGRLSPTRAEHVREEFGAAVRVVLDGGECQPRARVHHRRLPGRQGAAAAARVR